MGYEDVWIFLSYAHDDDLPTSVSKDEKGFVTFLHEMLSVKLRDLGAGQAKIWRDTKRISMGDQRPHRPPRADVLRIPASAAKRERPKAGVDENSRVPIVERNSTTSSGCGERAVSSMLRSG